MPTFGDYETVGEPSATRDERGHISTVWLARVIGAEDGRLCSIKCYAPHRRGTKDGTSDDALDRDRGIEFLEGVKHLKRAQEAGGRCLSPVHAFGTSDEGVWYVSDLYTRGSLKAYITRKGAVDDASLRHVVYSVATGCLALKRATGHSHGNLRASNVFLVGKPRLLRSTPLVVSDPYPASGSQILRLDAGDRRVVGDLFQTVVEAHDLQVIGELILQLVEGRLVASGYDYNYPIARSPAWDSLGKGGERWRQLCNRLLNPQLSLVELNLEVLAKQFRPNPMTENLPMILGVVGVICVLGSAVYFGGPAYLKSRKQRLEQVYVSALAAAQAALGLKDYAKAIEQAEVALRLKRNDPEALKVKTEAQTQQGALAKQEQDYKTALAAAQAALGLKDYAKAIEQADVALKLKQNDPEALKIKTEAQAQLGALAKQEQDYKAALAAAQAALGQKDYAKAIEQADVALRLKRNDPEALKVKTEAQAQQGALAKQEQDYKAALAAAQAALGQKDYAKAIEQADVALRLKRNDPEALKVKTEAETQQGALAKQEQDYKTALAAAQAALGQKDYAKAIEQAEVALRLKRNDPEAQKVKTEAQTQQGALAKQEQDYKAALAAAQAALGQKDYAKAIEQADVALRLKRNDPEALKVKTEAQAQQGVLAKQEQDYKAALAAAQAALGQKDYAKAIEQADVALRLKRNDPEALKVKTEAQTQQGALAKQEQDYKAALAAAQAALGQKDYAKAIEQADVALRLKRNDPEALKVKTEAQTQQGVLAKQEQDYKAALAAAQAALGQKDYAKAIEQADVALRLKQNDPEALKVKTEAQALIDVAGKTIVASSALQPTNDIAAASQTQSQFDQYILKLEMKEIEFGIQVNPPIGKVEKVKYKNGSEVSKVGKGARLAEHRKAADMLSELYKQSNRDVKERFDRSGVLDRLRKLKETINGWDQ